MNHQPNAEQYRKMKAIVAQVMTHDSSAWPAMAEKLCGDDQALKSMVLGVLENASQETGHLGLPNQSRRVKKIGAYQIVGTLGEGGMGVVYLAERTDQFRQRVAIKCLRSEIASAEGRTRFRMERQILAHLHHPNIAKILDGGVTESGSPYFVMEYIEGTPLPLYADQHRMDIKARLALFQQVCKAVHYAHQNLIINRDIKPGNILVERNGTVKLLDFGIAKLLNPNEPYFSDLEAVQTRTGAYLMTPQYASPEQVLGQPATIATDIYALGLLLFELLVGKPVNNFKNKSWQDIADIILNGSPTLPSKTIASRVSVDSQEGMDRSLVESHGLQPRQLEVKLQGDLDCIVMMALRKEPARRYSNVSDFDSDIGAYLKGQPVAAHPEKWSYLFKKYLGRNKLWVGLVAVIALSLITLALGSLRFAQITQTKNTQIAEERDQAQAISQFLVKLLRESDPLVQETNPTLRSLLARARTSLAFEEGMSDRAKIQLNLSLVEVFIAYDFKEEAEDLIEQILATATEPKDLLKVKGQKAVLLGLKGDFRQAWPLYQEAEMGLVEANNQKALAELRLMKGLHQVDATKFGEGIATLEQVLSQSDGTWSRIEISVWRNLGRAFAETGRFDEALQAFDKAQSKVDSTLGPEAFATFDINLNRIVAIASNGDYEQALASANQAIPQMKTVLGPEHALICGAMAVKASCLTGLDRLEEALALRLEALDCFKNAFGEKHHQIVFLLNEVGVGYSDLGKKEKASEIYREAIQLGEEILPPENLLIAIANTNLGSVLNQLNRPKEAILYSQKAYEATKANPDVRNYFGVCAFMYGSSLQGQGDHEQALIHFKEALQVVTEFPTQAQFLPGLVHYKLSISYNEMDQKELGTQHLQLSFEDFLAELGPENSGTLAVFNMLKAVYQENEQTEKLASLEQALQSEKSPTTDDE